MLGDTPEPMDALVAEHVMGWTWVDYPWYDGTIKKLLTDGRPAGGDDFNWLDADGSRILFWDMPKYSTNIAAAWQIVEALAKEPHWIGVIVGTFGIPHAKMYRNSKLVSEVWINLDNIPDSRSYSERCAGAICLAALEALGVALPDNG
jgi:hypothetical protein